ncbi:quinone oxidoreductase [Candidatus Levibacter sp. Uisw_134_01]|jgi:NADPH2:quinone reductase|uniref:quinone oxidoreductase family protein n=1 Tax=Candidatus Levibacter sp. Uisw_134_01 TaxID=3230999 RepID=UPI003D472D3F
MKSISVAIEAQGAPSVMKLSNVDIGLPKEGEVLIRQSVIGVNYMDIYQRSGYYPMNLPSGIGLEASGIIESIGAGVNFLTEGDRVVYSGGPPGSYADVRNVLASRVVRIPENIEDEQAAAIFLKGTTAEYLLERAYPISAGQTVLFHAAAGGVGLIAGQWGKAIGARMIGVAGGPEKCALAKEHGYTEVIDRNNENVVARVKELTDGKGVPVVYDSVGKDTFEQSVECLSPRGYFMSFGTTSGSVPPIDAAMLQHKGSLYFTRPTLANYCASRDDLELSATRLFKMIANGDVKTKIGQRYKLSDVVKSHLDLEAGKTFGSSILIP